MKKLDSIKKINFTKGEVCLDEVYIGLGDDFLVWYDQNCEINYDEVGYMETFPLKKKIQFEVSGIQIYLNEDKRVRKVTVSCYEPGDDRNRFYGEIEVFDKQIPKPFLSEDIEMYFPGIKIDSSKYEYGKRFRSFTSVYYPINDEVSIQIMMSRNSEYVGAISLTKSFSS